MQVNMSPKARKALAGTELDWLVRAATPCRKRVRHQVVKYTLKGEFLGIVAGLGKHQGTWDSDHPRSTAYRLAKALQMADPLHIYTVSQT
jgi:hypothetical protein